MKTVRTNNRFPHIFLGIALACLLPLSGFAQNARLRLDNLEKLSNKASSVNQISLEGDTLQLALQFMDKADDPEVTQAKDVIKRLKGIYVRNFEFDKPNQYTASDVQEIRSQLAAPGWTKIVESHEKASGETNEIYLAKDAELIVGVAILVAEPQELTVVNIVGPIDLSKLGALAGKFGIPQGKTPGLKNRPQGENQHKEE